MNQQERTTSALPTGHERPDARSFACAVNGVRVTGTVSHSPINPENYLVTVVVANRTSFDFEIIKRSALRYGVPLVHRVDASGAHRFRWTAATLMARPVLVLLPVEEAFEFGITKCVKWHLRVHDEENEERAAARRLKPKKKRGELSPRYESEQRGLRDASLIGERPERRLRPGLPQ